EVIVGPVQRHACSPGSPVERANVLPSCICALPKRVKSSWQPPPASRTKNAAGRGARLHNCRWLGRQARSALAFEQALEVGAHEHLLIFGREVLDLIEEIKRQFETFGMRPVAAEQQAVSRNVLPQFVEI